MFGFVSDEQAGASVIANNPDFRSDAGQFAQVDFHAPTPNTRLLAKCWAA